MHIHVNLGIIAGYWFASLAIALFAWRAWYIYRNDREQVFRYVAEGTGLLALSDFLYGLSHVPMSPRLLTGVFFGADAALIFGIYFASELPFYYWGRIMNYVTAASLARSALLAFCIIISGADILLLLAGERPLVTLNSGGLLVDGAPAWFNYAKALLLLWIAASAGPTFLHQGLRDQAKRQIRLGLGIVVSGLAGVVLVLINSGIGVAVGVIAVLAGVALIVLGLFTPSADSARLRGSAE